VSRLKNSRLSFRNCLTVAYIVKCEGLPSHKIFHSPGSNMWYFIYFTSILKCFGGLKVTSGIMNIIVAPRRKRAYYKPNFKSMQSLRIHCGNMHSVQFFLSRVFVLFKRSVNLENACSDLLHSQWFTPRTCRFLDVFLLEVYWILLKLKPCFHPIYQCILLSILRFFCSWPIQVIRL